MQRARIDAKFCTKEILLAVQNSKSDFRDFDAIPELTAWAHAENFCRGAKLFRRHGYLKRVRGHVPLKKFAKSHSNICDSLNHLKSNFCLKSLAFVIATLKK